MDKHLIAQNYAPKLQKVIDSTKTEKDSETTIALFIQEELPNIVSLTDTVMSDGRLTFREIVRVIKYISERVDVGLDIYTKSNSTEKLKVVREIVQFVVDQYYAGKPEIKNYLMKDSNLDGLINFIYQLTVKRNG